ncbi:MAG: hypothetical protein WC378_06205 [Opitutaceae bacterium]|jgi:hypothetical protein
MKLSFAFSLLAAFAGFMVAGCSTPESRIKDNPGVFNRLTPAQQELIKKGQVDIGFDADMVHLAIGEPDHVRVRTDAKGTSEVWIYTTWESSSGVVLYRGWYHRRFDTMYPYYLESTSRRERDHFRVTFREGKVVSIETETK